jgi:hypothetical protein
VAWMVTRPLRPWKLGLSLVLLSGSPFSLAARNPVTIDGVQRPFSTETTSVFRCGRYRVELGYREERFDVNRTPTLERALRVTLLRLVVSGRRISSAERARAGRLFRTFAWIDRADLRCASDRIQINVVAMPKDEWIAYIEERRSDRPSVNTRTVEVSPRGRLTIDGPSL